VAFTPLWPRLDPFSSPELYGPLFSYFNNEGLRRCVHFASRSMVPPSSSLPLCTFLYFDGIPRPLISFCMQNFSSWFLLFSGGFTFKSRILLPFPTQSALVLNPSPPPLLEPETPRLLPPRLPSDLPPTRCSSSFPATQLSPLPLHPDPPWPILSGFLFDNDVLSVTVILIFFFLSRRCLHRVRRPQPPLFEFFGCERRCFFEEGYSPGSKRFMKNS